jgi:DNA polymerase-3 subunit beta
MISIETKRLQAALSKAQKGTSKSHTEIKVEIIGGWCNLTGCNFAQYVTTKVPALMGDNTAEFVLPDVTKIIKALNFFDTFTDVEIVVGKVIFSDGFKKVEVCANDSDNFPSLPVFTGTEYSYSAKKLSDRYDLVKYAISKDETKPILTGVHFDKARMVALDGYRLAINSDEELRIQTPFTVPEAALKLSADILKGTITITQSKQYISIEDADTTVISRLLDGEYIHYEQVFPKNDIPIIMDRESLKSGLTYLKAFSTGKNKDKVIWVDHTLNMGDEYGKYAAAIEFDGQMPYEIGFNLHFMVDMLTQFKTDEINMVMGRSNISPAVIQDEQNYALLLPVRLAV